MDVQKDIKLEKILRNNLISAYLDYIEEFGIEKAQEVCTRTCQGLQDEDYAKILRSSLISAYSDYIEKFGKEKGRRMCTEICQGLVAMLQEEDFVEKIENKKMKKEI